jgi:hypothetical protein
MTVGYATTNFPNGVTNVSSDATLGTYVAPDPVLTHAWVNDFDTYLSSQWTVTETQGAATQAVTNGDGGLLALVNSTANNDVNAIQWANEIFTFEVNKQFWGKTKFQLNDVLASAAVVGLQTTDTTPLATTNGVFFRKSNNSAVVNLVVCASSTESTLALGSMVNSTTSVLGFYYDGQGVFTGYFNGSAVGTLAATNMPTAVTLAPQIAVVNGTAAAKTLTIDYLMLAKDRG